MRCFVITSQPAPGKVRRRIAVFRRFIQVAPTLEWDEFDHSEPVAGRSVGLGIPGPTQSGTLAVLVCALAVFASVPTAEKGKRPHDVKRAYPVSQM